MDGRTLGRTATRGTPPPLAVVLPRLVPPTRRPAAGASLRVGCVLSALLAVAALASPAWADDCCPGGACLSTAAVRLCDADQAQLAEVLVELRVTESRLSVAAGDALVLSRALDVQSALVRDLRRAVVEARPWLPGIWYVVLGGCVGVLGTIAVALSL